MERHPTCRYRAGHNRCITAKVGFRHGEFRLPMFFIFSAFSEKCKTSCKFFMILWFLAALALETAVQIGYNTGVYPQFSFLRDVNLSEKMRGIDNHECIQQEKAPQCSGS